MFLYTLQDPWWNLPAHTAVNSQEFLMDMELGKLMNLSSLGQRTPSEFIWDAFLK